MKIYFVGSHATGKTTLARYVSEKYNIPMITEVARMILSEKELNLNTLRYDLDVVDDYQSSIFHRQLSEEKKYNDFVSDRSLDCLAYAAQHSRTLSKSIHSTDLNTYLEILKDHDSFIFFVRPTKATLKDDGIRESINWDNIVSIDAMIKFMLEMFDLRYFQINTDNMQERVRFVDSILTLSKKY